MLCFLAYRTNLFFCPKIRRGCKSRSGQITVSPNIDQSGAVVVFTSAFCGEAWAIFDRFDHHPEKKHCTLGYVDFHQNFNGRRFSIARTISVFGIAMRLLKLGDLWHFENHCSHFCVANPTKLSKRRAQTDDLKSTNLPQLFSRQISTSLLQSTPSCTINRSHGYAPFSINCAPILLPTPAMITSL